MHDFVVFLRLYYLPSILQQRIKARISPQAVEDEPEVELAVKEDGAVQLAGAFQGFDGFVVIAKDEITDGDVHLR